MGEGKGDSIENKNKNAQLTIQCELFGNPCTAAGPKARAVFIAAPVYGTANLLDEVSCAIPCCEAPVASGRAGGSGKICWPRPTYKWQANSVRPTPICIEVRRREEAQQ